MVVPLRIWPLSSMIDAEKVGKALGISLLRTREVRFYKYFPDKKINMRGGDTTRREGTSGGRYLAKRSSVRVGVNASAMHFAITYRESFLNKNSRSFRAIHSLLSVSGKRKKLRSRRDVIHAPSRSCTVKRSSATRSGGVAA